MTTNKNIHKATLYATRGIPGSGKSYIAEQMVKKSRGKLVRINRDDLREKFFNRAVLTDHEERVITKIQDAEVIAMLSLGKDVIVDDTSLQNKALRKWEDVARGIPANFEVINVEVPLELALERNRARAAAGGRFVPEKVIIDKFQRFCPKGKFPRFIPSEEASKQNHDKSVTSAGMKIVKYEPDYSKEEAWIFDLDGTLALFEGLRGPFEWDKVGNDLPHRHVIALAKMVQATGQKIIITSGREDVCFDESAAWLFNEGINVEKMFMRKAGDGRKDSVVKYEIFDNFIRDNYNICGVVDDRLQVCRLWFDLGMPLFRVGDPEAVF